MRHYSNLNDKNEFVVQNALCMLADKTTCVNKYRLAFSILGRELGKLLAARSMDVNADDIMLVCASEDADWLAKGVEVGLGKGTTPLSVYWSTRSTVYRDENEKLEISPIVKAYEEPMERCRLLVVVKSIISSSCVVKTQLTRLIGKVDPERIAIVAPVMYKDGMPNLLHEFPAELTKKFEFFYFAIDDERSESGEVIPGIGGMVYPRLGLGDISEKNRYIPQMVVERM